MVIMVNNFIHIFSPLSIWMSAVSLLLASLCPPIYDAAFERMYISFNLRGVEQNYTV